MTKWMNAAVACLLAVVIVLVLIAAALIAVPTRRRYGDYLSGLWAGDPTFLRKAGLRDAQLFVSPTDGDGMRQGYLLMTGADGAMIANQAFDVAERLCPRSQDFGNHFGGASDKQVMDVEFQFDDEDAMAALMPSEVSFGLSMLDGSLSIYDDSKLYGFFYKDNAASHAAKLAWQKGASSSDAGAEPAKDENSDSADLEAAAEEVPDDEEGESDGPDEGPTDE